MTASEAHAKAHGRLPKGPTGELKQRKASQVSFGLRHSARWGGFLLGTRNELLAKICLDLYSLYSTVYHILLHYA